MVSKILHFTQDDLSDIALKVMALAKGMGATDSELEVSVATGTSVSVRMESLEAIELHNDKTISIIVYFDKRRGISTTSDFTDQALQLCVEAACQIAKYTSEDQAFGLADSNLFAKDIRDLDLFVPCNYGQEQMIEKALECESNALSYNAKIMNSEGAQLNTSQSMFIYANSAGFIGGFPSSMHSLSCSVVASDDSGMQRDYSYTAARSLDNLKSAKVIGQESAERALKRLGPQKINTGRFPVIFEAPIATSIISSLAASISGGNLFRETSFLLNSMDKKVASNILTISEDPLLLGGHASTCFDDDGVKVEPRIVIDRGYLQGYFLSSYSARRLGMETTGNAGGAHNLIVSSSENDFNALVKQMDTGLIVTELLGHGLNMVTGDYSRGVVGFWVEHGNIKHAVEEITIAGNMKEMLLNIITIGKDTYLNGSKYTGSILIDGMTVASNS